MGRTKLLVGVRHIAVVIVVLVSFQQIAVEIEELHDADFHHDVGWQEEIGTPRGGNTVDKLEYPETRGSPRLCNTNECAIELSVIVSNLTHISDSLIESLPTGLVREGVRPSRRRPHASYVIDMLKHCSVWRMWCARGT